MRYLLLIASLCACRTTLSPTVAPPEKDPSKAYEAVLGRVVTPDGYVDYDALEGDRAALDRYVAWLSDESAWQGRMTKDWHSQYLNAYNALVLFQVLERDRPDSVLDPRGLLPVPGWAFFNGTQFTLGIEALSLSEIENERLRWKEMDYRDHAAMNCASMSCPPMRNELYRTPALQSQLDDQMLRWVGDNDRGVRIENGSAAFSPIFEWFARDFEFFSAGLDPCTIAAEYSTGERRTQLYRLADEGCPHTTFDYDWSLNHKSR